MGLIIGQHLPFQFPGKKRAAFAIKLSAFLLSGFSIPFLAASFQLQVLRYYVVGSLLTFFHRNKAAA